MSPRAHFSSNSMDNGITTLIAFAFAPPVLMILVGAMKEALPGDVRKGWVWVAAAFVSVLAAGPTGLLESIGINPLVTMQGVLLCGLGLALFEQGWPAWRQ